MQNLAGAKDKADPIVKNELRRAKLPQLINEPWGEVGSVFYSEYKGFTFHRAWNYWIVEGKMPVRLAREIYKDPVGSTDVRASGHCGNVYPEVPWTKRYNKDNKEIISNKDWNEFQLWAKSSSTHLREAAQKALSECAPSDDPASEIANEYVELYHVDSEVGLRLLVDFIDKINPSIESKCLAMKELCRGVTDDEVRKRFLEILATGDQYKATDIAFFGRLLIEANIFR